MTADIPGWPPERLRALDEAVALARGWKRFKGRPKLAALDYLTLTWHSPENEYTQALTQYSRGCRETFELMEEAGINVTALVGNRWLAVGEPYESDGEEAPTPTIAVCLAYLAVKGKPFKESR